jgi:hypothetical protein
MAGFCRNHKAPITEIKRDMTSVSNGSDLHFGFCGMWQSQIGSMTIRRVTTRKKYMFRRDMAVANNRRLGIYFFLRIPELRNTVVFTKEINSS